MQGRPDIAVGNALGSNIANVGLVIGITALITPLAVHSRVLLREFPIMLFCMIVALVACLDGALQRVDGAVLGIGLVVMMVGITWVGIKGKHEDALVVEIEHHQTAVMTTRTAVTWLVIGIALLLLGSNLLVEGSVVIARHFGMSDLVIGLTIVAVGTSLPELAASVASAWKGEPEIALGNVIGSNMFNILGVLAVPALIHPTVLEPEILARDMPMMFGLSLFLYAVAYSRDLHGTVTRLAGAFLLAGFCGYQWWLVVAGGA
jgi:cation:H+ antiporter